MSLINQIFSKNVIHFSTEQSMIIRRSFSKSPISYTSNSAVTANSNSNFNNIKNNKNKSIGSNISITMNQMNNNVKKDITKINNIKSSNLKISDSLDNVKPLFFNEKQTKDLNGIANITNGGNTSNNDIKSKVNNNNQGNDSNNNNNNNKGKNNRVKNANGLDMEDIIRLESFFDSYKVVQEFKKNGFTNEQSLLLMKYTYFILQEKLEWLNQTYAPKVEMENEAYLFEAAHSELLFETTNSREISLMNLTNAMIILKRGFNNLEDETLAQIKLNDDIIKMELNQFKHENNLHQKTLNLKNSDLNSRIISDMVSGLKSEIETFRWQLTRAGILSIMLMAISIMGVWNLTKKLADDEIDYDYKGPLLQPVHQETDEESHDYEADWDENVVL